MLSIDQLCASTLLEEQVKTNALILSRVWDELNYYNDGVY